MAGDGVIGKANLAQLETLVATDTMALPTIGGDGSLFPGMGGKGVLTEPLKDDPTCRLTFAVLHSAPLTDRSIEGAAGQKIILNGSFVGDPRYAALAAALSPDRPVLANQEHSGTATGAALLASHEARSGPALLYLHPPIHVVITSLADYRTR